MKVLAIIGWSGSGKTTLISALIPAFQALGLRVSSIKHAHHALPMDQQGKDSFRHAEAGAEEVILTSPSGFTLFHRRHPLEASLPELLARLAPVDLVLVEGFKPYDLPRLEVHRPSLGQKPLWPEAAMLAVASDAALPDCAVPVLKLDEAGQIADYIVASLGLSRLAAVKE